MSQKVDDNVTDRSFGQRSHNQKSVYGGGFAGNQPYMTANVFGNKDRSESLSHKTLNVASEARK